MRLLFLLALLVPTALAGQPVCFSAVEDGPTRLTSVVSDQGTGGTWTPASTTTNAYDDQGRLATSTFDYADPGRTDLVTSYTYDDANRRTGRYDNDEALFLYAYSDDGLTREERQQWRGGPTWDTMVDRYRNVYDADCRLLVSHFEWYRDGAWQPALRTEYDRDGGRLLQTRSFGDLFAQTQAAADAPTSRTTYHYDGATRTGYTTEAWDPATSTFGPFSRAAQTYVGDRLMEQTYERWQAGAPVIQWSQAWTYTPDGDVETVVQRSATGGSDWRWTYTYEATAVSTDGRPVAEAPRRLTVAGAHPTRGALRVAVEGPGPAALAVYDVLGRRVAAVAVAGASGGRREVAIGEILPPGTYVVRLTGDGAPEAVTLTKVR